MSYEINLRSIGARAITQEIAECKDLHAFYILIEGKIQHDIQEAKAHITKFDGDADYDISKLKKEVANLEKILATVTNSR